MATFDVTSDERSIEFVMTTTDKIRTYRGTLFSPNCCKVRIEAGKVTSMQMGLVDANGWGIDDPAGPDGAEMWADFGGGELDAQRRSKLPTLVKEALGAVETVIS